MPSIEGLGPLDPEYDCDAPPYSIVVACADIGIQRPLDIVWEQAIAGRHQMCHNHKVGMKAHTFTYKSGTKERYHLGQCEHCKRVFWRKLTV